MEVVIPEMATDVQTAEILALLVRVGQHVLAEQPVLELEAGKASFELPCPVTGRIEQILVRIGDDVKAGDVVLTLQTLEDCGRKDAPSESSESSETPSSPATSAPAPTPANTLRVARPRAQTRTPYVRASPLARRRARELVVDLDALAAEHRGRVTVDQVEARAGGGEASGVSLAARDEPELELELEPTVSHLAEHRTLDVTCFEAARRRYREQHESGPRLTLTAFVIKACALALREHPRMNSSLIRQGRALAIKRYVHIGVGDNSDRKAGIPVLVDADRRPLHVLAVELDALAGAARASPGAEPGEPPTFSVVTFRGFVGTRVTPTIQPPQVGTLGLCRARSRSGRTLLPVSLAYDRRVHDELGARSFLATIAELLHDPIAMLMRA